MLIKQISVFVENKSGRLAEITKVIADANIDMRALSIADTTDFGILRVIVNKPDEAEKLLREAGMTVSVTNVIAIGVDDHPGCFSNALQVLASNNVDVEYMYAFVSRDTKKAYIIVRVADNDKAIGVLTREGIELLDEKGFYEI